MREIEETSITIDHDLGRVWIDTRNQAFAGMCKRAGLVADGDTRRAPYVRFSCTLSDVDIIVRRHHARRPSPEVIAAGRENLRKLHSARAARQK